ncbi:MAG: PAS domain-containing protein [Bacteroidota bacterium]
MKYSVQPTSEELVMRDNEFIISKTDLQGKITYANRTFMEYSGFTEQELLNAPHSIIRHPDMPRGVFKLLWDTVQSGVEICAYVKNMSKSGAYYWVFANVTPVVDGNGAIVGYYSVRRKPKTEAIRAIEPLYREMLQAEQRTNSKEAPSVSVQLAVEKLKELSIEYDEFVLSL